MTRAKVLYDADCGFCKWALAKLLVWDREGVLEPVTLQEPAADRLLGGMDNDRKMASWHLVTDDGRIRSGGDALAPLARLLPGGGPLAALGERAPALARSAYELTARNRGRLAKPLSHRAIERASRRIAARR